jgi:hypothetical protein
MKKAAEVKGIKGVLDMSDDDLAKFVKQTGDFSDEFADVTKNLDTGYGSFKQKYGKQVSGIGKAFRTGENAATDAMTDAKSFSSITDDIAKDVVKNSVLEEALEELDTIVRKVASEEVAFAAMMRGLSKGSSSLYKHIVLYGGAFSSGSEGGIFSFEGTGWFGDRSVQLEDKWLGRGQCPELCVRCCHRGDGGRRLLVF